MKKSFLFLVGIVGILIILAIIPDENRITNNNNVSDNYINTTVENIKSSAFWEETSIISINASATGIDAQNWTWAIAQGWCSGSGIVGDPYLIENMTITVSDPDYAGLTIYNNGSFYTLNNITIVNDAGDGLYISGENGTIIDSTFNGNGAYGVYMLNANHTTISGVNSSLNTNAGIYMDNCVLNNITGSSFDENTEDGMVMVNCTYNIITSSYFLRNTKDGLNIQDSDYNNFTVEANDNNKGFVLTDSDNCVITNGQFWDNTVVGVLLIEDDGDSTDNLIYNNIFDGNGVNGNDSCAVANSWDNGRLGNRWSDYIGNGTPLDGDDDGIGDDGSGTVVTYTVPGSAGAVDHFPLYDDGAEPTPHLGSGDTYKELFAGEKNAPQTLDINSIILIVVIGAIAITVVALLMISGMFRPKIRVRKRIKGRRTRRK